MFDVMDRMVLIDGANVDGATTGSEADVWHLMSWIGDGFNRWCYESRYDWTRSFYQGIAMVGW